MRDLEDELADIDLRVQLFANLAGQRRVMRFPLVNLPAGKLPETGEVDACCRRVTRNAPPSSMTAATTMITIWTCAGTRCTIAPSGTRRTWASAPCTWSRRNPSAPD